MVSIFYPRVSPINFPSEKIIFEELKTQFLGDKAKEFIADEWRMSFARKKWFDSARTLDLKYAYSFFKIRQYSCTNTVLLTNSHHMF